MARLDAGPWPGLADLARLERPTRPLAVVSRDELERVLREGPTFTGELPTEPDLRFEAAVELAREHLADQIANPGTARDVDVLDTMRAVVAEHVQVVLFTSTRHDERAVEAAIELGIVALPGLEYEVLRSGRFPYGPTMYGELRRILAALGEPALPIVIEWLTHGGWIARHQAASTLAEMGPASLVTAPFLISAWRNGSGAIVAGSDPFWEWDLSQHPDVFLYIEGDPNAAWAAMGPPAIPVLTDALDDPNARVRRRAAHVLPDLAPDSARDALPALRARLDDEDPTVRRAAARAVLALGGDEDPAAERAAAIERGGR